MAKKERGLGRGLDALLSGHLGGLESEQIVYIEMERIRPRPGQPRTIFNQESITELAQSIQAHGLLQPVLLRSKGAFFEIIAGERRWRAAQIAGLEQMPALVKELDDGEAAEVSLIENVQRDDLTAVEEARAYRHLMDKHGYTQERIAGTIGKSRAHIANTTRILALPGEVLQMVENGQLTAGHARALLGLPTEAQQIRQAQEIIDQKMTVREAEALGRKKKDPPRADRTVKSPEIVDLEERLQEQFSTRVEIQDKTNGGKIQISYYDDEDLDRILDLLLTD